MSRRSQSLHGEDQNQPRSHLEALTGLRFVAALAVVLDHYWLTFAWWDPTKGVPSNAAPQPTGWLQLAHAGGLGVDCFFILSGFILAYTYVAPAGGLLGTRRSFWVARIARIYPVYVVALALDALPFLMRPHSVPGLVAAGVAQPLLLQAWIPYIDVWKSWDPPSWSLSAEAFFYLLFPFILIALARRSRRVLWAVAGVSVAVFALLPVVLIVPVANWWPQLSWLLDQVLYFNPLVRLPEFTLGVALGLLFVRWHQQPASSFAFLRESKDIVWDAALVALLLLIAGLVMLPLPPHYLVGPLVMPVFAAGILLLAQRRGAIARLLSRPRFVWLGETSFSIYILHTPIWAWLVWISWGLFRLSPTSPLLFVSFLAAVLVASGLSYRYIEKPSRAAIRSAWAVWEARHAASPVPEQEAEAVPAQIAQ